MAEQILPEMQDIARQRDLAKMLLQRGMADNLQGQMVSGRYVGASPLQGVANLYSAYKGKQLAEESDKKQAELAKMLRQQGVQESQDILSTLRGRQAVPEVIPQGQTLLDDQGMPTYGAQRAVAGIAPDLEAAYAKAAGARTTQGQAFAPLLAKQLMPDLTPEEKRYKAAVADGSWKPEKMGGFNAFLNQLTEKDKFMIRKDTAELADKGIYLGGPSSGGMPSSGVSTVSAQGGGNQVANMGAQAMGYNPNLSPAKNRELAFNKANRQAEFAEKAPAALEMMNQTLTNIDDLIGDTKVVDGKVVYGTKKPHEGFESSVGATGAPLAKYFSGTPVADFRGRFDQIKDKTFLQAFETLKGSGQITEIEGAKATSALNRMSLAQSEKEFITAAREFEQNIKSGMELARKRAGMANPNSGWRVKP